MIRDFTDLMAWQKSHELVKKVYDIAKNMPDSEKYALSDQIRRAAVSVTSNIAEGFGRRTIKDRGHFYDMGLASLYEVRNQLILARDLGYVGENTYNIVNDQAIESQKLISGLITATRSK